MHIRCPSIGNIIIILILWINDYPSTVDFVSGARISARIICSKIPNLTPDQRNVCESRPRVIVAVGDGTKLALKECQNQFKQHRWNCSSVGRNHLFGQHIRIGSREAAFTTAIHSAGVTYKLAQGCSLGTIGGCGCDRNTDFGNYVTLPGDSWKWGGCSDDIKYSMRLSARFLDDKEKRSHRRRSNRQRALMNLHNKRAGRKAVKVTMNHNCKCHGVSGSCTVKTCWKTLADFTKVGTFLKLKYHHAKQVEVIHGYRRRGRSKVPLYLKLKKTLVTLKKPRRKDLVFLEHSPDYCLMNKLDGSLGTGGRQCTRTTYTTDHCDFLCCGRGYDTVTYDERWQCNCKFHWCCHVTCDTCTKHIVEYTCK